MKCFCRHNLWLDAQRFKANNSLHRTCAKSRAAPVTSTLEEQMDYWLNIGVEGFAIWPSKETAVSFGGRELLLRPATKDTEQSIHINLIGINDVEALTLANRFLSVLSWCDGQGLKNLYGWSGNPVPVSVPKRTRRLGSAFVFPFSRDVEPNPKALLALALYREGRSIDSTAFEFLSYFKILNIFWKDRFETVNGVRINPLVEGIRNALPKIADEEAAKRVSKLCALNEDPADYLYQSGRCAIAHAHSEPIVDPDDVSDLRRLSEDMWIVRAIAEQLIEEELNVRRTLF